MGKFRKIQLAIIGLVSSISGFAYQVPAHDGAPLTQAIVEQAIRQTFEKAKPPGSTLTFTFNAVELSPASSTTAPGPNGSSVPTTVQKVHVTYSAQQQRQLAPAAAGELPSNETCTWNPDVDLMFYRPSGGSWDFTINRGDPTRRTCTVTPAGGRGAVGGAANAIARVGGHSAIAVQSVPQTPPPAPVTTIRIEQPVVTQKQTEYPNITLRAGDRITIGAGGCVQTGGLGLSTYRYVNPAGPEADRIHFGTVRIPGVTDGAQGSDNGYVKISTVIQRQIVIPGGASGNLGLGYTDNDGQYADNGYQNLDAGVQDQCKGIGPAWVMVTLLR